MRLRPILCQRKQHIASDLLVHSLLFPFWSMEQEIDARDSASEKAKSQIDESMIPHEVKAGGDLVCGAWGAPMDSTSADAGKGKGKEIEEI